MFISESESFFKKIQNLNLKKNIVKSKTESTNPYFPLYVCAECTVLLWCNLLQKIPF